MRLFLNLDTLRIHEGGITTAPVQAITLTRGDAVPVELTFFRGTTPETLPDGSTIRLAVKEEGDFSGSFLASLASWTRSSDTYSGTLSCNTTEITTAVGTDTSISCALEIAWDVSGVQLSARPVKTTLLNDYIKGTEGVPTDATPAYPLATDIVTRAQNLADLISAAAARTNLGATSTGSALFIAADASAARTTLGATSTGAALFTSTSATAARATLGLGSLATAGSVMASLISDSTTTGRALLMAANESAARSTLGATTTGSAMLMAADAPAANNVLWESRTSAFTASPGGRYVCTGTFSVTNPAGGSDGQMYQVLVASGSITINGAVYGASRWPLTVCRVSGTWTTLPNSLTDTLTLAGSLTVNGNTTLGDAGTDSVVCNASFTNYGIKIHDSASVAISSNTVALPAAANVVQITGTGPVNTFAGGFYGAIYWIHNSTGGSLTLTNSATIECRGGANIVLGANESATVVVLSPGVVAVH